MLLTNPRVWSPESPELYLIRCFVVNLEGVAAGVVDEYDFQSGFRKVGVSKGDIMLNGKRLVLKGVTWYEDHPLTGSALSAEELEKDVVLVKNLGANTIRIANHPPDPALLSLCDRYGLMVMEEIPLCQAPASVLAEEAFLDLAGVTMKEMIIRDRNHPSVLAWGLGDEFDSSAPVARPFVESLVSTVRSLDDRPTYFGSRMLVGDVCSSLVDIAAVNVYTSDVKTFKAELEEWRDAHRAQPILITRFGCEVQQGNRNGYSDPLSQQAQARYYLQRFDILRALDYDGGIIWSFNDWRGDRPSLTVRSGDPWEHTMGLVNARRDKRLAYDAVRSIFHGEKYVALPIGNYAAGTPIVYVLAGFIVLVGMAYFYNASRRFRDNVNRSVLNAYNFFADIRDQHVVSLIQSTILGLVIAVAGAIVASSVLFHFRESLFLDNLLSYMLVSDTVKAVVVRLIWNPLKFIGYVSAAFFFSLVLVSAGVMMLSILFKTRIYPFHAYSVTMWSTTPLLALIPVGMIIYRVMEREFYVVPALVLIAVLHAWVVLRFLKGISIIFDVPSLRMYAIGVFFLVCVAVLLFFYYDATAVCSHVHLVYVQRDDWCPVMYLSKLEMIGFKSFAQKVNLAFDSGISAIVGPNGCGKTNIVDAIRWVLGEQRYSALRSEKMEDVIFNGTKTRKPLGMAEASLVIENTKGILPSEYTQVTVGRRVFRSGESEYLLNKVPCRLKDILDLFMDTGMGADAYSVIELKMVETILSDKTDERRRLFEEAAGVTKYKHRRKAAYRKLESVQADLVRVNDIVAEVQKAVNSLERQARSAEQFNEVKVHLRDARNRPHGAGVCAIHHPYAAAQ